MVGHATNPSASRFGAAIACLRETFIALHREAGFGQVVVEPYSEVITAPMARRGKGSI